MNTPLKLVDSTKVYKYNSKFDIYESMTEDEKYMEDLYNESLDLKIVGIVCPKGDSTSMSSGVGYTKKLTEYVINKSAESEIVKKQLANKNINVFSGKDFDDKENDMGIDFQDLISIDEKALLTKSLPISSGELNIG